MRYVRERLSRLLGWVSEVRFECAMKPVCACLACFPLMEVMSSQTLAQLLTRNNKNAPPCFPGGQTTWYTCQTSSVCNRCHISLKGQKAAQILCRLLLATASPLPQLALHVWCFFSWAAVIGVVAKINTHFQCWMPRWFGSLVSESVWGVPILAFMCSEKKRSCFSVKPCQTAFYVTVGHKISHG